MFIIFILVIMIKVSNFYNFFKIHFIFTYVYGCMSVCVPRERALDPLELESQAGVCA